MASSREVLHAEAGADGIVPERTTVPTGREGLTGMIAERR
jgi:hypothetical protein